MGSAKGIDAISYVIRSPHGKRVAPGAINLKRAVALSAQGSMHPAGVAACANRDDDKSKTYSYGQRKATKLPLGYEKQFRRQPSVWKVFNRKRRGFAERRVGGVISARTDETRLKRLAVLIDCWGKEKAIPRLTRPVEVKIKSKRNPAACNYGASK